MFGDKTAKVIALALAITCLNGCSESGRESSPQARLNDTGITWGANYPRGVNSDCTAIIDFERLPDGESVAGDILSQQDCNQGRDTATGKSADGTTGFAYRKIGAAGEPLPADAQSWHCVLDEISGLAWEVKQPGDGVYGNRGRHDADDVFTWYNPDKNANGGAIGDWNSRYAQCTGYIEGQPATYCNIEEFVSRTNRRGLCGFNDWRVPTMDELSGLVNFGRSAPAIDTTYFPNTKDGFYWSHSPDAGLQQRAWAVNFQFGYSAPMPRDNGRHIRLVRDWAGGSGKSEPNPASVPPLSAAPAPAPAAQGCNSEQIPASAPTSRYRQQDDGSVADTKTGLIWRACLEGSAGAACDRGEPLALNWAEALTYVAALDRKGAATGDGDWRLPNIRELGSLLELQCAGPAINRVLFSSAASMDVWSSSPANFHTHYSWYVDFASGALTYGEREKPKAIRLVRDAR
ncbi:DUF1566 domain-containing protein [Microbulbifer sp. SH-1]|uniref:Lcl C-terminal domain-containing protein n=1 Tax=Microbulbifer sp. SH-1 TaxID=2681547 RepID=UPI00140956B9|nr:DUF1566 domain-containing protein [Microbulbifer sp. SH-1]QIL91415.1 DUF1566 domain-containing protein [Microbulbifer sp. SH-1]